MGAGVSLGSLGSDGVSHPPGWGKFLTGALSLVGGNTDRQFARQLIKSEKFLDAAEVITECSDHAEFGAYVRRVFAEPRFTASDMHKVILDLDPKIIITTNYDQIYDQYCNSGLAAGGYNIARYYDRFVVENIRSNVRVVIKAHGCVSDVTKIVLSRSSYYKARRDNPGFYQVLDALFLTSTLLFVGCSLTDPDIQLVLENANISAPSVNPHYALVEKAAHRSLKAAIKTTYNIELIEYRSTDHDQALTALNLLRDRVIDARALR